MPRLLAVQDGAFSGADCLDLAVRMLATEDEVCIIAEVLERARRDIADRYVDPAERTARLDRLADAGRRLLADAVSGGPCPGRAGTAPRHHGRERVCWNRLTPILIE